MMDDGQMSTSMNEKRRGRRASEPPPRVSFTAAHTGSLNEISGLSEQISGADEDAASPPADVCGNISHETKTAGYKNSCESGAAGVVSPPGQHPAEKEPHPLPSETTAPTRSPKSTKSTETTRTDAEADGSDLCAAVLLSCLFCRPLDCVLAALRGCDWCVWSACWYVCGCERAGLQPLLDVTHACGGPCRSAALRWLLCDCPVCDVCLQAGECLDLAMEMSQMLNH